jgi:UPF0042 nucleotide-binding protein
MNDDRFLIITGLSGSGKTVVSHYLEDMGYYCVDNLPAKLIPSFVELWLLKEVEIQKVALVVDIREPGFLQNFPRVWQEIRKKITPKLIFLDASDEALVKRFSESRRPHPFTRKKTIIEGVRLERKRMEEIKQMADEVIDTSATSIAQLKEVLAAKFLHPESRKILVGIVSFGYKHGIPLDSDLVFDTRFLPNPYYEEKFSGLTGKSRKVKEFVLESKETQSFLAELLRFIDFLMPQFIQEGKSYLTISIGCTGGKHRSVVIADKLKEHLQKMRYSIRIHHRDIFK